MYFTVTFSTFIPTGAKEATNMCSPDSTTPMFFYQGGRKRIPLCIDNYYKFLL